MPDPFRYLTTSSTAEIAQAILSAQRVALVSHQKPDGDALGAQLALARALHARRRHAEVFVLGPVEEGLLALAEPTPLRRVTTADPGGPYDLIVVLDTGAWSQLEPLGPWLRREHERVVGIDHHAHGEEVAARRIVDPAAASTTLMLLPILREMGVGIDGAAGGVGEALFLGLATDTGWFRFANADGRAFAAAAELLAAGVDKLRIYLHSEENHRPQRLALAARALASLRYARGGAVAIMALRPRDFTETGGTIEDLSNVVNLPMTVGTVRVSIFLCEVEPGRTKISLRSKPAQDAEEAARLGDILDVNRLANAFGGGGHVHAAGARVDVAIDRALESVLRQVVPPEQVPLSRAPPTV